MVRLHIALATGPNLRQGMLLVVRCHGVAGSSRPATHRNAVLTPRTVACRAAPRATERSLVDLIPTNRPTPQFPEEPSVRPVPRSARFAVTAIFAVNGLILSNWVPRIPAVQRNLDLGEGQLGLALLGVAVGALLTMPLIGGLVARFGSRPATTAAVVALAAAVLLPALAGGLVTLTLALVALGAANGALDVAMNAQAVAVERRYGLPIMSSFHAAFSFGGLAGAILGGLAAAAGIEPLPHLAAVGVAGVAAGLAAARGLLPAAADAQR